ncbi:MAG: tripartite tricarboxylate transporter TctB family protein [Bacteroidota bacterium]|nr:tripartite tricarboxylate transporter TctB family protein [Kiloniellaceae bacterium]
MDDDSEQKVGRRKGIGADLILPAMAVAYAIYYLYTVADFSWEARMSGVFLAVAIFGLVAILVVRTFLQVRRGEATLALTALTTPRDKVILRLLFIGLTALSILLMPWLGFTLSIILFNFAGMLMLGVRNRKLLAIVSVSAGAAGYALFILALDTRLPYGPIEWLLQSLR